MSIHNCIGKSNMEFKKKHLDNLMEYFDHFLYGGLYKGVGENIKYLYHNLPITDLRYIGDNKFEGKINGGNSRVIDSHLISFDFNRPNITASVMKPVIQELYEQDDQLLENQKIMTDKINSLQENIDLLTHQNEELKRNYQQLLINWTTINEYMKKINSIEEFIYRTKGIID
jgi:hypothetical protein